MEDNKEFRSTFKFKDGMVIDHPHQLLEFGVYSCLISPLLLGNGRYRGFMRLRYNGDGFADTQDSVTKETFETMKEAIIAAKIEASEKYRSAD